MICIFLFFVIINMGSDSEDAQIYCFNNNKTTSDKPSKKYMTFNIDIKFHINNWILKQQQNEPSNYNEDMQIKHNHQSFIMSWQ